MPIEFYTHDPEHLAVPKRGVGIFLIDANLSSSAMTAIVQDSTRPSAGATGCILWSITVASPFRWTPSFPVRPMSTTLDV